MEDKIKTYSRQILIPNADYLPLEENSIFFLWDKYPHLKFQIGEALNPINQRIYRGVAIFPLRKEAFFVPLEGIGGLERHLTTGKFHKIISNPTASQELADAIKIWEEQQLEGIPISPI